MDQAKIRNVAIIAHVDHGKTTLVDKLFEQSGMFSAHGGSTERLMDSMDIEQERGITITSKSGGFRYNDFYINIIDTPGHADFGGQVERVLKMACGAILVVDAQEGPMPQTFFVLKKALALDIPIIVAINKIDKPAARPEWVLDQVFDLFVKLEAPDDILDFPVVYVSAKEGYALRDPEDEARDMAPLLEMITEELPPPAGDAHGPFQLLISSLDYSPFLGRLAIGKITNGSVQINDAVVLSRRDGQLEPTRISKIYKFEKNEKIPVEQASCGDIIAVAGMDSVTVGETFTSKENPLPLEPIAIDPPTISMNFIPNDSPFAGQEGTYVTSRHIGDRLRKETLSDVALHVEDLTDRVGFKVSGRGELHLSILIETMRREGYELQVTRPQVIYHTDAAGKVTEPYEEVTIDVSEEFSGVVIDKLNQRKGKMVNMLKMDGGLTRIIFHIPTRGLLGYRSEFMTDTQGMGMMNYVFHEYGPYCGELKNRHNGAMVSMEKNCVSIAYALANLQERGTLFIGAGEKIYAGQIIGENSRSATLKVNPAKGKKLSNVRSSGADDAVVLTQPRRMTLEDCIAWINDDELVEITPENIRLRKMTMSK
ncbi:translational GTPase TypA [Chitinivibrio alkaliphilus]|uniref:50S ribosomal subunit assembly factor BipA n=1 Tax=Chitinivibrio alkaliphilus ACht1 TaxID=1313304 RepID=U7D7M1_9BACT|nr:translational GTPase TypA [Chitinivibrio alkaliphilus]ERP31576.1 GTP-binding protein TypA/BipA [Chitinivibrio alkaliphilus ACht1]